MVHVVSSSRPTALRTLTGIRAKGQGHYVLLLFQRLLSFCQSLLNTHHNKCVLRFNADKMRGSIIISIHSYFEESAVAGEDLIVLLECF